MLNTRMSLQYLDRHGEYFPSNRDIAFNTWNYLLVLGLAISYLWSTAMCVFVKIYILITLLCTSLILYGTYPNKFSKLL